MQFELLYFLKDAILNLATIVVDFGVRFSNYWRTQFGNQNLFADTQFCDQYSWHELFSALMLSATLHENTISPHCTRLGSAIGPEPYTQDN